MLEIRCRFWRTRSTLTGRSDGSFLEALCLLDAGDGHFASCTCHFLRKKATTVCVAAVAFYELIKECVGDYSSSSTSFMVVNTF